jgi:hypothetical protein
MMQASQACDPGSNPGDRTIFNFVKFIGKLSIDELASDDCHDPDESVMTMIWILS